MVVGLIGRAAFQLTRANRRWISLAAYMAVTAASYHIAFLLRFEFDWRAFDPRVLYATLPLLLAIRLGVILGLFLTLPYGKFVHAIYRFAALVRYAIERRRPPPFELTEG